MPGRGFEFYAQSWHARYGWGNSRIELYLVPAPTATAPAALNDGTGGGMFVSIENVYSF